MRQYFSIVSTLRVELFSAVQDTKGVRANIVEDSRIDETTGRLVLKYNPEFYPWPNREAAMAAVTKLMCWSDRPVICEPVPGSDDEFFVDPVYPSMLQISTALNNLMRANYGPVTVAKIEDQEEPGYLVTLVEGGSAENVRCLRVELRNLPSAVHTVVCQLQDDGRILVTWNTPDVLRAHSKPPPRGPTLFL